jgi:hypothetical protein
MVHTTWHWYGRYICSTHSMQHVYMICMVQLVCNNTDSPLMVCIIQFFQMQRESYRRVCTQSLDCQGIWHYYIPPLQQILINMLMEAVAHVLRGPAAAVNIKVNESTTPQQIANTRPRAAAWGITQITPACIAAGATMVSVCDHPLVLYSLLLKVRFALSDQRIFSTGGGRTADTWPYLKFYHQIIKIIESTMSFKERTNLLDWYTMYTVLLFLFASTLLISVLGKSLET